MLIDNTNTFHLLQLLLLQTMQGYNSTVLFWNMNKISQNWKFGATTSVCPPNRSGWQRNPCNLAVKSYLLLQGWQIPVLHSTIPGLEGVCQWSTGIWRAEVIGFGDWIAAAFTKWKYQQTILLMVLSNSMGVAEMDHHQNYSYRV